MQEQHQDVPRDLRVHLKALGYTPSDFSGHNPTVISDGEVIFPGKQEIFSGLKTKNSFTYDKNTKPLFSQTALSRPFPKIVLTTRPLRRMHRRHIPLIVVRHFAVKILFRRARGIGRSVNSGGYTGSVPVITLATLAAQRVANKNTRGPPAALFARSRLPQPRYYN